MYSGHTGPGIYIEIGVQDEKSGNEWDDFGRNGGMKRTFRVRMEIEVCKQQKQSRLMILRDGWL